MGIVGLSCVSLYRFILKGCVFYSMQLCLHLLRIGGNALTEVIIISEDLTSVKEMMGMVLGSLRIE